MIPTALPPDPPPIVGRAAVIDGDTIEIRGQRIRLWGIDAPESRQPCTREGQAYRCGQDAANHLDALAREKTVSCAPVGRPDRYRRVVAICSVSTGLCRDQPCIPSVQLNELMVADGQAVDYPRYSRGAYARLEADARQRRAGVWGGEFQKPWEWRAR